MPYFLNLCCLHCSHTAALHSVNFNTIAPNAIVYLLLLVQSIFFLSNSVILYLIHYSFNYSVDFKQSFSNSSIPNGIAHLLFHFLLNWSSQNLRTIFFTCMTYIIQYYLWKLLLFNQSVNLNLIFKELFHNFSYKSYLQNGGHLEKSKCCFFIVWLFFYI